MKYILVVLILGFSCKIGYRMEDDKIKEFLNRIAQIESSGGKNFDHPEMESGIHEGHQGIGRYGLMPNTVNETLNRMRLRGSLTTDLAELRKLDADTLKQTLEQNPEIEDRIAGELAKKVLSQHPDDEMAAYSWNQGHNLKPEDVSARPYKEHDYVKKYNNIKKMMVGENNE